RVIAPLANHRVWSVVALTGLSGILTLCSTSDAFIAATFTSFPLFARMAFLVFGPMFDFKLLFLYSVLFRKRFVLLLGVGLFVVVGVLSASVLPLIYAQ
ncbi:MAG: permease, partial [Verrucomicrobia bacterium]|nr:permease [Verrucomicrobiota bacterium]